GAETERMRQHDRAVGAEQIVQPAVGARGLDYGAKRAELRHGRSDGVGVFAADGDGVHDFTSVVHAGDDHGQTMKVDAEIPHTGLLVRWTGNELRTSNSSLPARGLDSRGGYSIRLVRKQRFAAASLAARLLLELAQPLFEIVELPGS